VEQILHRDTGIKARSSWHLRLEACAVIGNDAMQAADVIVEKSVCRESTFGESAVMAS
jgi:hypothetical protein